MSNLLSRKYKYDYDVAIIKKYGDIYRLSTHRIIRNKGFEDEDRVYVPKGSKNDLKLLTSLSRSKRTIFELAMCNDWDWFCTFTINPEQYDRNDLHEFRVALSRFFRDYSKANGIEKIHYLIVPEQHRNGGWHLHGLISGIEVKHLREFQLDEKIPRYIRRKLEVGKKVYDFDKYREKFGYNTFEEIRSKECASRYLVKYITKDLEKSVSELEMNLYYCSQGLKRAEEICRGNLVEETVIDFDYEDEYYACKWLRNDDDLDNLICC